MTASIPIFSPMVRVTDANGDPVALGTVEFYNAGTSTPKTVYADKELTTSLGTTVSTDSGGYPVTSGNARTLVYTGTDAFKMIVKDASAATLVTHDNVPGAVIVPDAETSALSETPIVSKTTTYTVVAGDQGTILNCNCTSAAFAVTLLSAVTAGDGFEVTIRHTGTANQITVRSSGTETISHAGKASYAVALKGYGQTITLVSDGANWQTKASSPPRMLDGVPFFTVADRLTATPAGPTPGARYIITGSPTGAWSTLFFTTGQVAEADGNGSWFAYTPADGWTAYVEDEDVITQYRSGTWTDLSNVTAPNTSALKVAIWADEKSTNTSGGTSADDAWTTHTLQTERVNTITGSSLSGSQFTLPTGKYRIDAQVSIYAGAESQIRLYSVTNSTVKGESVQVYTANYTSGTGPASILSGAPIVLSAYVDVTAATEVFALQYYVTSGGVASGLGRVRNIGSEEEIYALVTVLDLTSIQGPAGTQGTQGSDGLDAAFPYQWSTATSGDPGSGKIRGNNATIASITEIGISITDSAGGNIEGVIDTWDSGTSTIKARMKISKEGSPQNFHYFYISGSGTDQGSYWTFPVTYTSTGGTIANTDAVAVLVLEKGDKGDTGTTGAQGDPGTPGSTGATGPNTGLDYAWATATSGDPGSGKVLANNATLSSATAINISKTGRNSESLGAVLATWDDSTNTAHYGHLRIFTVADRTEYIEAEVTGLTDNSTYYAVAVTVTAAAGTPSANDVMAVMFERTGNKGADGAGSFTSLSPGAGTTSNTAADAPGSAITTTGTLSAAELVNAQTGTTYTVVDGDRAKLITLSNASSIAVTLPQAGASNEFKSGWFADFFAKGAGTVTITPTTSTINGASSLTVPSGRGLRIVSDGTNYQISDKPLIAGTDYQQPVSAAVLAALAFGPFTTIASATTTDLSTVATVGVSISGTTTITSFGTGANLFRIGKFAGALTLTHNATTLILPSAANITTAAGDRFIALSDGSGNWTVVSYIRANGYPLAFDWGTSQNVKAGSFDFGHASDTTVDRAAAGVIQVEGVPLYSQIPQNSQSAAYTLVLSDAQKHIYHPSSDNNARTFTIPANSSVAYPIGTCLTFINAINTVTIAITTDTLTLAGAGTTGSRTLAANGMATAIKVASTSWMISGTGLT